MFKKIPLISLILLAVIASACKEEATAQPPAVPGQMETDVAEQVAIQLTQIAANEATATFTPSPTLPATEIPSATATLPATESIATLEPASPTPLPPSLTNTSPAPTNTLKPLPTATTAPYLCSLTKQTPGNGKTFKPGDNFDAVWTVKNVGSRTWDESEVDYKYESGDKFHQTGIYDLPKSVKPGESVDLIVDMEAPDKEGEYKTVWVLHLGKTFTCKLSLEINVEK